MKSKWKNYKLDEVLLSIFSGGTPSTRQDEYWNGEINWLSSGETRNQIINKTEKKITPVAVSKSSTRLAKKGDVVIASAGQGFTRGQTSLLNIDTYINQSIVALRADPDFLDNKYLFYNLSSRYQELRAISDSASIRGSITTKMLKQMNILLPQLDTQKKISTILFNLDSKIELNNQMIVKLEELASTLFKRWFVEFEFPDKDGNPYKSSGGKMVESELGQIPENWEIEDIASICINNKENISIDSMKIEDYVSTENLLADKKGIKQAQKKPSTKNVKQFRKNDILISNIRPYFKKIWYADKIGGYSNDVLNFRADTTKISSEYLFFYMYQDDFFDFMVATSKGTKMPRGDKNAINKRKLAIPPSKILNNYSEIAKSLLSKIIDLRNEINSLKSTRNALLPKLLAGDIKI